MAALGSWAALEMLGGRAVNAISAASTTTQVSMVGDSLTCGTLPYQADAFSAAGWARSTIDAHESRGVRTKVKADPHTGMTAVDAIRSEAGDSDLWIVALGSNDAGIFSSSRYREVILQMIDRIGVGDRVMWVNTYLPAAPKRQQDWNAALTAVAVERPDEMFVYDWASIAAENKKWLSKDHVHCTGTGYQQRATAIAQASSNLVRDLGARRPASTGTRRARNGPI